MSAGNLIGLVFAVGLFGYLFFALIRGERL
jgi:K+-transporting ATPase KdpF subunit